MRAGTSVERAAAGRGVEGPHAEDTGVRQEGRSKREREKRVPRVTVGNQTRETFCVYLRTSDKEVSLSSDLGRAEN